MGRRRSRAIGSDRGPESPPQLRPRQKKSLAGAGPSWRIGEWGAFAAAVLFGDATPFRGRSVPGLAKPLPRRGALLGEVPWPTPCSSDRGVPTPLATYRLQLHAGFDFAAAAAVAPYLHDLGVSHAYCSPYLQAAAGSTHGYDVTDPSRVNEELGGEAGHARFCAALGEAGLGQVLDIVPNHMSIDPRG